MIIFGGWNGGTQFSDTWALSLGATPGWTNLVPAGPPPARYDFASACDPSTGQFVVYGGHGAGSTVYGDVWSLSLNGSPAWTQIIPSGSAPSARYQIASTFLRADGLRPPSHGHVWQLPALTNPIHP